MDKMFQLQNSISKFNRHVQPEIKSQKYKTVIDIFCITIWMSSMSQAPETNEVTYYPSIINAMFLKTSVNSIIVLLSI